MTVEVEKPRTVPQLFSWLGGLVKRRAEPTRARPPRRLTWPLRGLLVASLAVPLLLLGIAAWQNYRLVRAQAEERVMIEADELHEQALDTLKTYAIVLAWIDGRTRGLSWDQIEHEEELHRFLADLDTLPQIEEVSIVDDGGHPWASGRSALAPSVDVSNRDCFVAEKEQNAGVFVGREQTGPLTPAAEFDVCERRSTTNGSFGGIIVIAAKADYFSDFYKTISEEKHLSASLVRSDGSILVRYPAPPFPYVLPRNSPFMQTIAIRPDSGSFWSKGVSDGVARFYAYQRVEGYPLYVTFGIPRRGMLASWWANLINYSLFAVPASLALFGMTWLAVRQIQRHRITSWRWQTTARRLRREMNRRNQAEAELRQSQKMEALGQLTGGVAHDFNNLLTVLQGCLEILTGKQQNEQLQARVDMALRTVERGERLTGQLLAFARRQPLARATIDLNAQLRRMTELLVRTVGSGIAIHTDLAPDLWLVDADATQLELAVINLAINARDAMPGGGELGIRTFNREVSHESGLEQPATVGDFVGLEISDTGHGMQPEAVARAFEPFFTTKEAGKGTGLGLSMVYGFARQSGGSASIRSEIGRGTAVTLLLPRGVPAREADGAVSTDLPQGAST
ncbi:MAG: hybrid sensor histidine kinase/response regulator [Alphaproteobacteria bacterium]|nr:hybrid sensor histidine kinase/response regulator [Alphaproteobacteria bacterium]